MRRLLLLSACLLACAALAYADDKDKKEEKKEDKTKSEASVSPLSIAISRKLDAKAFGYAGSDMTTFSFVVSVPKKPLLSIDSGGSKVAKFEDDKGNSLMDEKFPLQFFMGQVSQDRSAMTVSLYGNGKRPGKGATKLILKGDLSAVYGTDEKSEEIKKVKFEAKSKAKAGDFEVTITQEKGGFNIEGPIFNLTTKTRAVKGVTVKDGDGKEMEVQPYGSFPFGESWTFTYAVKKAIKEGSITVNYYSKEEKVTVPIDLSASLDLGGE